MRSVPWYEIGPIICLCSKLEFLLAHCQGMGNGSSSKKNHLCLDFFSLYKIKDKSRFMMASIRYLKLLCSSMSIQVKIECFCSSHIPHSTHKHTHIQMVRAVANPLKKNHCPFNRAKKEHESQVSHRTRRKIPPRISTNHHGMHIKYRREHEKRHQ